MADLKIDMNAAQLDCLKEVARPGEKHPKCLGWRDEFTGEYDCDYGSVLACDECKYGVGSKDPEAKCNQL